MRSGARVHALAIGAFRLLRFLAGTLRSFEIAGDRPVTPFDHALDFRHHSTTDREKDRSEHQQQPE